MSRRVGIVTDGNLLYLVEFVLEIIRNEWPDVKVVVYSTHDMEGYWLLFQQRYGAEVGAMRSWLGDVDAGKCDKYIITDPGLICTSVLLSFKERLVFFAHTMRQLHELEAGGFAYVCMSQRLASFGKAQWMMPFNKVAYSEWEDGGVVSAGAQYVRDKFAGSQSGHFLGVMCDMDEPTKNVMLDIVKDVNVCALLADRLSIGLNELVSTAIHGTIVLCIGRSVQYKAEIVQGLRCGLRIVVMCAGRELCGRVLPKELVFGVNCGMRVLAPAGLVSEYGLDKFGVQAYEQGVSMVNKGIVEDWDCGDWRTENYGRNVGVLRELLRLGYLKN